MKSHVLRSVGVASVHSRRRRCIYELAADTAEEPAIPAEPRIAFRVSGKGQYKDQCCTEANAKSHTMRSCPSRYLISQPGHFQPSLNFQTCTTSEDFWSGSRNRMGMEPGYGSRKSTCFVPCNSCSIARTLASHGKASSYGGVGHSRKWH